MRLQGRALVLTAVTALAVGGVPAPAVAASPMLSSADPAPNAVLGVDPAGVTLTFDQDLTPSSTIAVSGPSGICVQTSPFLLPSAELSCDFLPGDLSDGTYTVSYTADPDSGADPATTDSYDFVLDATAPAAPTGVAITPDPYTVSSDTLTVTGTSESADDSVAVVVASGASTISQTVAAGAGGDFTATFTAVEVGGLPDGTLTASARSTDQAGNEGADGSATSTKDTDPPGTPSVSVDPDPINTANQGSVTVSGSSDGDTVDIMLGDGPGGAGDLTQDDVAVVAGSYSATFDAAPLPDGTVIATVVATDAAGNNGSEGSDTATKDTAAPGTPSVSIDPDPINSADQTAVVVSGSSDGDTVTITVSDGPGGGADLVETEAVSGGTYAKAFDLSSLADGTITATVLATDAAGNTGGTGSDTATKDTDPPGIPTVSITPDPITSANQSAVTVSGASDGATVTVTVSDGPGGGADLVDTVAVSGGSYSKVFNVSSLADGTITATVTATDGAGNIGGAGSDTATKDTDPPGAPTVSISPDPINASNQTAVTVSGSSNGASVTITVSDGPGGGADLVETVPVPGGSYSQVFDVTSLDDGTITATVTATDNVGNTGAAGTDTATKDTVPPGTPTVLITPDPINAANQTAVTVSGTSNGATVTITVSDGPGGGADLTDTVAVSGGNYSRTFNVTSLDDGTITATVTATDNVGNTGAAGTDTATKDTVPPGTPTVLISPDPINAANQTAVTVSGASNGATVTITVSDGPGGGADLVETVTVSGGTYSKVFNVTSLNDGAITATVTATDAAGNTGAAGTDTATKDTVPPGTPTVLISPDPINAANQTAVAVSGASNGATVTITVSDGPGGGADLVETATVSGGTYSKVFNVSSLNDGTITATVAATDAAGNTGAAGTDTATKDTVPPGTPTVLISPDPINAANQTAVTVSGSSNGATVTITVSDGPGGGADLVETVTVSGGTYSKVFDVTSLNDGTITATVTATDAAGNTGAAGTDTATKDTVPPGTPTVLISPDPINAANQTAVTVSGSSNGATVDIVLGDGPGGVADLAQDDVPVVAGTYSATFNTTPLPDGTVIASVTATDAAGNTGAAGTDTATKDTGAPPAPTVQIGQKPINIANQTAVTVSGTSNGATVTITVSDGPGGGADLVETVAVSAGSYSKSFDVTSLNDGTVTATGVATDNAGNNGAAGTDTAVMDTVAPAKSASSPAEGATVLPPTPVTITFSEALASGSIAIPGVAGTSSFTGSTVTFTPSAPMPEQQLTATATVTDLRGNPGSGAVSFVVDDGFATTTTTLNPLPPAVSYQKTITLSGQLSRPDRSVAALPVMIAMRDDAGRTQEIALVTPNASGAWSFSYRPKVNGTFTASYLGDRKNAASTSPDRTTKVRVGISASAAAGPASRKATIKGSVTPAKVGAIVQLRSLGKGAKVLMTTKVKAGGRFTFKVKLPKGKTKLQVSIGETPGNLGASARLTAFRT